MTEARSTYVRSRDIAEMAIGGSILALPMAVTQEIWDLTVELSLTRMLVIGFATLCFLAVMVWLLIHNDVPPEDRKHFARRVLLVYAIALLISATMLLAIDRLPVLTDPILAIKRTIMVAVPVSFGATTVDNLMSNE